MFKLTHSWVQPITDISNSFINILYGAGLHNLYGDGGFTAILGWFGVVGLLLFYLPILYVILKIKNINIYLNTFYFSTIVLLISNITYVAFTMGKLADIYWFLLGATLKYLSLMRKNKKI